MDEPTIDRFPTGPELAELFPGYRVIRLLSETGGSQVYLAEETALRRRVALKILHQQLAEDAGFRERFTREVLTAARLEHRNIVPVYAAGESGGRLYLVMRFVEGADLESVLRERGPLPMDATLAFVRQVAAALDAAHRAGLVHRDVKPKNVLVDADEEHVYLCDFGIAKNVSAETIGTPGQFVGTPAYASPEQVQGGPVDGRADVYALGGLVYRCLTGRTAFEGDPPALLWAHLKAGPPKVSDVRPELGRDVDRVVAKAMAKRPQDRFATCGELADTLAAAVARAPKARSRRVWAGVAAVVVALGVAAVVVRPWQQDIPSPGPSAAPPTGGGPVTRLDDAGAILHERPGDPVRLTGYEVRDPKTQLWTAHPRTTLAATPGAWQSTLSPDGAYLVERLRERAPGGREVLKVTDVSTGRSRNVETVRTPEFAYVNAWSRDGKRLVLTLGQNAEGGWRTTGFGVLDPAEPSFTPVRLKDAPLTNAWYGFDPEGTGVVALSPDLDRQPLRFYSLTGEPRRRVQEVGAGLAGTMFSPSGRLFLTNCPGLTDADHCVHDVASGKEVRRLTSSCTELAQWFDEDHLLCRIARADAARYAVIDLSGAEVRTLAELPANAENVALEFTPVVR